MLKVAFIGAGARSVAHMTALTHLPDVQIVALAELDAARAQAAQDRANSRRATGSDPIQATVYSDYRDMLAQTTPDVVYLCLPPYVHGPIDHDVIDYGKPVLFEKPVAVEMSLANEIADHVRASGIVNAVGYQKRYSNAVLEPRKRLQGMPIGMAVSIRLSGLPQQPWWRVQAQSGGMLVEQHTHAVDLMRFLCGDVELVFAIGANRLSQDVPNMSVYDMNAVTLRFANGAPGIIGNSCAGISGAPVFPPHLVHVVTKGMTLSVNDAKTVIRREEGEPEEILPTENDNLAMNRTFIEAAQQGNQGGILSDYADGMRTFAVTLACQRSAESGQPIALADFMAQKVH